MRGHALRSAEVDALLRHAPRVTHLEVAGFASGFDASLQGRPCAWRELGFAGLRITSFAHLPLGALQRLWCWRPSELVVEPWACDEAHCQAVAELLGRCYTPPLVGAGAGGFQEETHVICSCSSYEEELAGVAHVLAALRPFATVHFTKIVLSALMLARLSQVRRGALSPGVLGPRGQAGHVGVRERRVCVWCGRSGHGRLVPSRGPAVTTPAPLLPTRPLSSWAGGDQRAGVAKAPASEHVLAGPHQVHLREDQGGRLGGPGALLRRRRVRVVLAAPGLAQGA